MNTLFTFESFSYDESTVVFRYVYDVDGEKTTFEERLVFPVALPNDDSARYILQNLHIGIGISYYKSLRGPVALLYKLNKHEVNYWNTVYNEGLGEFSYENNIAEPITPFVATTEFETSAVTLDTKGALLGMGGGKDSTVSGELLKKMDINTTTWELTPDKTRWQASQVTEVMNLPSQLVERTFDTTLADFSKKYAGQNGHVPISMIYGWVGVLLAYTTHTKYVVMGNEAAADTANVVWNGRNINHQWSKTLEFETMMQQFVHHYVSPDIWYFSLLRPFGSLKVLELFSETATDYFEVFTSCNRVFSMDSNLRPNGRWCGECPKCLSTYMLICPFIDQDKLEAIFGKKLLHDLSLEPLFKRLLGLEGHKPMDCVGTIDELRAAVRRSQENGITNPLFDTITSDTIDGPSFEELLKENHEHRLPPEIDEKLSTVVS